MLKTGQAFFNQMKFTSIIISNDSQREEASKRLNCLSAWGINQGSGVESPRRKRNEQVRSRIKLGVYIDYGDIEPEKEELDLKKPAE